MLYIYLAIHGSTTPMLHKSLDGDTKQLLYKTSDHSTLQYIYCTVHNSATHLPYRTRLNLTNTAQYFRLLYCTITILNWTQLHNAITVLNFTLLSNYYTKPISSILCNYLTLLYYSIPYNCSTEHIITIHSLFKTRLRNARLYNHLTTLIKHYIYLTWRHYTITLQNHMLRYCTVTIPSATIHLQYRCKYRLTPPLQIKTNWRVVFTLLSS